MTEREPADLIMSRFDIQRTNDLGLYIEDDGYLVLPGGLHPCVPREPVRKRYRFDEADDQMLLLWVASAEKQGLRTTGLELFCDLERANPRHTAQSWQSRWMRKLKDTKRPEIVTLPLDSPADRTKASDTIENGRTSITEAAPSTAEGSSTDPEAKIEATARPSNSYALAELPPSRWLPDRSCPAPAHFKPLPPALLPEREAAAALRRADNEKTLLLAVGLETKQELRAWLIQDWVVDAYVEYATSRIDLSRPGKLGVDNDDTEEDEDEEDEDEEDEDEEDEEKEYVEGEDDDKDQRPDVGCHHGRESRESGPLRMEMPFNNSTGSWRSYHLTQEAAVRSRRQSSKKYIVNNAATAIVSKSQRYMSAFPDKRAWSRDDFDIRFVVRIVRDGCRNGGWWEPMSAPATIRQICGVAWRLMLWIRCMHRHARSSATSWRRTLGMYWTGVLNEARTTRTASQLTRAETSAAASPEGRTASESVKGFTPSLTMPSAEDAWPLDSFQNSQLNRRQRPQFPEINDEHTFKLVPNSTGPDVGEKGEAGLDELTICEGMSKIHLETPPDLLPPLDVTYAPTRYPSFAGKESRQVPGQINALEWLSAAGRKSFQMQQDRLLATWGVRRDHRATCVMVPQAWSNMNPMDRVYKTNVGDGPTVNDQRLRFSLGDHQTSWVRAATWFNHDTFRNGSELDVFLGCGPFIPMDGSHLCHHALCIVPGHVVYEDTIINGARRRCLYDAQDLRRRNVAVPAHCTAHEPPCFLQLSALTLHETFVIQLWVLRQANSMVHPEFVEPPQDHPCGSFESQLPLSFDGQRSLLDFDLLIEAQAGTIEATVDCPVFYCTFCSNPKTFKKVVGYWGHIRDRHGLVDEGLRIAEIKNSAAVWRRHLQYHYSQYGKARKLDDPTQLKLQQIESEGFNWEVVQSWKLHYQRER